MQIWNRLWKQLGKKVNWPFRFIFAQYSRIILKNVEIYESLIESFQEQSRHRLNEIRHISIWRAS